MHDPIAYSYEADIHCPDCAEARFGRDEDGFIAEGAEDSEGNPVGIIAPWENAGNLEDHDFEDGPYIAACGTCGAVIEAKATADSSPEFEGASIADIQREWSEARLEAAREEGAELREEGAELREALETAESRLERLEESIRDYARGILTLEELLELGRARI